MATTYHCQTSGMALVCELNTGRAPLCLCLCMHIARWLFHPVAHYHATTLESFSLLKTVCSAIIQPKSIKTPSVGSYYVTSHMPACSRWTRGRQRFGWRGKVPRVHLLCCITRHTSRKTPAVTAWYQLQFTSIVAIIWIRMVS